MTQRLHELKIWPQYFRDVLSGVKRYEVRLADRVFRVDDLVSLREWDPLLKAYTGNQALIKITYVTDSAQWEMIPVHLSIFGFVVLECSTPNMPPNQEVSK